MKSDRPKFQQVRTRRHDTSPPTRSPHRGSRRDIPCDWETGSSHRPITASDIRLAADILRSSTSGWLAVYLGCVADGTVAIYRAQTEPSRDEVTAPVRPHKPRHWVCKAWLRCCTSASVSRSLHPTMWAMIDVALVVFFLWSIIQACRP